MPRRGDEPGDFWSQSLCWGGGAVDGAPAKLRVRFRNDGGKNWLRCEVHLVYKTATADKTKVTFDWTDDGGARQSSQVFAANGTWELATGTHVRTRWVELEPQ